MGECKPDTRTQDMEDEFARLREAVTEAHWIIVVLIRALEFSIPRSEMNSTLARVQDWLDKYGKE